MDQVDFDKQKETNSINVWRNIKFGGAEYESSICAWTWLMLSCPWRCPGRGLVSQEVVGVGWGGVESFKGETYT